MTNASNSVAWELYFIVSSSGTMDGGASVSVHTMCTLAVGTIKYSSQVMLHTNLHRTYTLAVGIAKL